MTVYRVKVRSANKSDGFEVVLAPGGLFVALFLGYVEAKIAAITCGDIVAPTPERAVLEFQAKLDSAGFPTVN